ncbi:hypothetical protein B5E64_16275 [Drancourtella sp. An12]|nr:hypothetical protein B5E64_16275 [Drancourtella sp. An12]
MKRRTMMIIGLIVVAMLIIVMGFFIVRNKTESASESVTIHQNLQEDITLLKDIQYQVTDQNNCYLDVAYKDDGKKKPLLIFVHGGSWSSGSKEDMNSLLYTFSALGYTTASVNYDLLNMLNALHGECISITEEEACVSAAADFLAGHAEDYQIDTNKVVLIGHSSGGQLAGHLSEQIADHPENYPFQLKGAVLLAPASDLRYYVYNNIQIDGLELPLVEASFIFDGVYGTDVFTEINKVDVLYNITQNLPPVLILHGSDDTSVPISLSENLCNALEEKGVTAELTVIPGATHSLLEDETVFSEINRFLNQYILNSKGE